jgi:hypothetical protein
MQILGILAQAENLKIPAAKTAGIWKILEINYFSFL